MGYGHNKIAVFNKSDIDKGSEYKLSFEIVSFIFETAFSFILSVMDAVPIFLQIKNAIARNFPFRYLLSEC